MRVTPKSRRLVQLQNLLFTLLVLAGIGLAAWLSLQYRYQADWTSSQRNSLTPATARFLKSLDQPLSFSIYTRSPADWKGSGQLRLLHLYQQAKPDANVTFVNPDSDPGAARAQGISVDGELVIRYGGRDEKLTQYSEFAITNALERLARSAERFLVFLGGDGERDPLGKRNFDLGEFGRQLGAKGLKVEPLNLAAAASIPQNTAVLVIAGPQAALLPGAVRLVRDYVKRGGNLLWLGDPGPLYGLEPLAADLGLRFGPGTVIDPDSELLGIRDPRIVLVTQYSVDSPVTQGLDVASLFPAATRVAADAKSGWKAGVFLETREHSFLTASDAPAGLQRQRGDVAGPIGIGVALTRSGPDGREQRVVVTGDGDFLSNSFLGNPGNLELGLNILNWLAHDDAQIDVNIRPAPDLALSLTPLAQLCIGVGFLFLLPLLLTLSGIVIWVRRRRR
jgi:hypothetical protein